MGQAKEDGMSALFSGFAGLGLSISPAKLDVPDQSPPGDAGTAQAFGHASVKTPADDDRGGIAPAVRQSGDDVLRKT
jgi:hypothetical protein